MDHPKTLSPLLFTVLCLLFTVHGSPVLAQQEYEITIETTLGDTTETFWLQIPEGYSPSNPCPLLIGWHQWGGNHWELKYQTDFDSIANARGWIAACHYGVNTVHWNNHPTQSHVVDMIDWIMANCSIDTDRIYIVGSSMGGAAGMVFSNNHLSPDGHMIAAAASMSGIQDNERRFYEQGINNSMIAAFGGTPEQAPYEYHRNSAIYFEDYTESMHFNAMHLPLYLTFGSAWSDSVWRRHAEDLYDVMVEFADTVIIYESALVGHGWGGCEEVPICDFFENFRVNRYPLTIDISADEEGQWYWANITKREPGENFARFTGVIDTIAPTGIEFSMIENVEQASLDLPSVGFSYDVNAFSCLWEIQDMEMAELALEGVPAEPIEITRNGVIYQNWLYDPIDDILTLYDDEGAYYTVVFDYGVVRPGIPVKHKLPPVSFSGRSGQQISFEMRIPGNLGIDVFDIMGRRVLSKQLGWRNSGIEPVILPHDLSSGIYFVVASIEGSESGQTVIKIPLIR